jgi:hypothetical protein
VISLQLLNYTLKAVSSKKNCLFELWSQLINIYLRLCLFACSHLYKLFRCLLAKWIFNLINTCIWSAVIFVSLAISIHIRDGLRCMHGAVLYRYKMTFVRDPLHNVYNFTILSGFSKCLSEYLVILRARNILVYRSNILEEEIICDWTLLASNINVWNSLKYDQSSRFACCRLQNARSISIGATRYINSTIGWEVEPYIILIDIVRNLMKTKTFSLYNVGATFWICERQAQLRYTNCEFDH